MINTYTITDSHCHIYPEAIAKRATRSISDFYKHPVPNEGVSASLIEAGKAAGVDRYVICSVAVTPAQVTGANRFIANAVRDSGGLFTGLGTLHPDSADIEGDIKLIKSLGLKGGKMHADIQKTAINDRRCYKIYEQLEGVLPVLLHTGDKRYEYSNPRNLIPVLENFPNLSIVGAHFGGWSVWEEAAVRLSRYGNLCVDTSSTFNFVSPALAAKLISKFGSERVLFGTDYPMWHPSDELKFLFDLNLTDTDYRRILHDNSKRVYG